MPYSRAVEERYRLQPADLNGPVEVTVTNVTLQGLETVQPVLHFDRLGKWLTLDDIQSDEMARATGSAVFQDWRGCRLVLTPLEEEDGGRIAISRPGAPVPRPHRTSLPIDESSDSSADPSSDSTSPPLSPPDEPPPGSLIPDRAPAHSPDNPLNSILLIGLIALLALAIVALLLYALGLSDAVWTWLMGGGS